VTAYEYVTCSRTRDMAQVPGSGDLCLSMDTQVHISNEALLRLIKQIDARPDPARLGCSNSELLVRRIRSVHPAATLRRRILVK
jgi:hypothetical protein